MKRLVVALVLVGSLLTPTARAAEQPIKRTPPGQVKIVTANALQNGILGIKRFNSMYELSYALRQRPPAFDGGFKDGVAAPGVIVVQEMRTTNTEIFTRLMRQRFKHKYQIAGPEDAVSQIIYDPTEVTPQGESETWTDDCAGVVTGGSKPGRIYQLARFVENKTATPFSVIAIHLKKNYDSTGEQDCYQRNLALIRERVSAETSAVIVAGDFNRRPVEARLVCDEGERSAELPWYHDMTDMTEGSAFIDTVRRVARSMGRSLIRQWTHEQKRKQPTGCGGKEFVRGRIDYIFARGAVVVEASADDPGWAGEEPGTVSADVRRYSDHRFVWARLVLQGPEEPDKPTGALAKGGVVSLSWSPVPGATEYLIYRGVEGHGASRIAKLPATTTSFEDLDTRHNFRYLYSVAASDGTGQGPESRSTLFVPDAKGPRIVSVTPPDGANGLDRRTNVIVRYDEDLRVSSIDGSRILLRLNGRRVPGKISRIDSRSIKFDPRFPLKRGKTYSLTLKPLQDSLGNVGEARDNLHFSIKPRRKR